MSGTFATGASRAFAASIVLMLVAACSAASGTAGRLRIVASTDVYGDIARSVVGDRGAVSSLITDPHQDPHSYEATTRDDLAISRADVIIENGGGYDGFVDRMRSASNRSRTVLINVVTLSGLAPPASGEPNEHVWYDLPTVRKLVAELVTVVSEKDPGDAATFRTNGASLDRQLQALERAANSVRTAHAGTGVAITEPVPLYLLAACGLRNKTPAAFSQAVEAGTDVPPAVLRQTLDLFPSKAVRALVYNAQAEGPETAKLIAAADSSGVPVVPMTETLPPGQSYLSWMRRNLAAIRTALTQ